VTYAEPNTTYREILRRFVADVRAKGGHPLLASPSARRGETGNPARSARGRRRHGDREGNRRAGHRSQHAGHAAQHGARADADKQFADRTHHSEYGAYLQAKCIVYGIKQAHLPLAKYIVDDFGNFDPTHPEPLPANFSLPVDVSPGGRAAVGRGAAPGGAVPGSPTAPAPTGAAPKAP